MGRRLGRKRRKVTLAEAPLVTDRKGPVDRRATDLHRQAQVIAVEVDDPYRLEPGEKIVAFKSLRDDPLERLKAKGDIEPAQYEAAKAYERDLELAEIGGVRAIDPTKEAVDGGKFVEPLTDSQRKATKRLSDAGALMGMFAESIVRGVLARNVSPAQLAIFRGFNTKREQLHYGWIFRRALDELAVFYGFAMRGRVKA